MFSCAAGKIHAWSPAMPAHLRPAWHCKSKRAFHWHRLSQRLNELTYEIKKNHRPARGRQHCGKRKDKLKCKSMQITLGLERLKIEKKFWYWKISYERLRKQSIRERRDTQDQRQLNKRVSGEKGNKIKLLKVEILCSKSYAILRKAGEIKLCTI